MGITIFVNLRTDEINILQKNVFDESLKIKFMTQPITEIRCPKCGSNQITANKKGFGGGKALAGVLLTGGIGLLGGTIGSNKIKITCLACGYSWKPGQANPGSSFTERMQRSTERMQHNLDISKGNSIIPSTTQDSSSETDNTSTASTLNNIDQRILELYQQKGILQAVKFCKDAKGWNLQTSKEFVESLVAQHGVTRNVATKSPNIGTWIALKVFFIMMLFIFSMAILMSALSSVWVVFAIFLFLDVITYIGLRNANKEIKKCKQSMYGQNYNEKRSKKVGI